MVSCNTFYYNTGAQVPGGEDAGDGGQAPGGAGGRAGGEGQSAGAGQQAERSDPGAGGSADPSQREQQRPAETTAGPDGHRTQPAQPLRQGWRHRM